jgi:microcystin-dependent protein
MAIKLATASGGSIDLSPAETSGTFTITVPATSGTLVTTTTATTFTGSVNFFAGNYAPTGWLKANGAAVSRTTYADLFAYIGTTYGVGDGTTTFNLPDMRGYFARGWVDDGTVDSGRVFGSTQQDAFASHTHISYSVYYTGSGDQNIAGDAYRGVTSGATTSATGGAETRPKNVALLACIKY